MDDRDMKQHLGLDQYEKWNYEGFHRHVAMVALIYAFIVLPPLLGTHGTGTNFIGPYNGSHAENGTLPLLRTMDTQTSQDTAEITWVEPK